MPPINHLNQPPNPFWDFVADMQDHPLFAAYGPPPSQPQPEQTRTTGGTAPAGNQPQQQQTNVEDPPEVDPTTLRGDAEQAQETRDPRFRGRRRCGSGSDEEGDRRRDWHGRRPCGRRGRHGFSGPFGQPGFPFAGLGGPPFWAQEGPQGPPPPPPPGFGPGPHGRGGSHHRGGPPHHHHGPPHHGPFHRGPPRRHGHGPHGRRSPSPPPHGPSGGFDVGKFLNDLGSRIGMDLSGAAEGLGLDRFLPTHTSPEVDFEPKADIFDRPQDYIVHLSLPGAKKSDVGVDWDGEHSILRVAGVVHRPGVDETMLEQLVVDGRKRETGVFEKTIRLGTRRDPALIDVPAIKAKMADGILIITVPKLERQPDKRDVPIAKSQTPSPARNEKQVIFDVDQEMAEAEPEGEIQLVDRTVFEQSQKGKGKQAEHEEKQKSRESSATVEAEPEQLPAYNPTEHQEGSDWEQFGSDDEGDYIKINVD